MEGESTESTQNTKVSDSAYSNSCSNSQSQRSGSSKSMLSGSHSSGSSGYGGKPSIQTSSSDMAIKRNKEKSRKKKKAKCTQAQASISSSLEGAEEQPHSSSTACDQKILHVLATTQQLGDQPSSLDHKLGEQLEARHNCVVGKSEQSQSFSLPCPLSVSTLMPGIGVCHGGNAPGGKWEKTFESCKLDTGPAKTERVKEDSFCCVISMHDGIVLYTTPSITDVLGFPRDMWLGRSFIDFVHTKDRATFASQITTGIPIAESRCSMPKDARSTFCVMLRQYRGLQTSGYGVIGRSVNYEPFRLGMSFREAPEEERSDNYMVANSSNMLLVICATPIKSSYRVPEEIHSQRSPKFAIRHTATGIISHVDSAAVSALGYLPQDLMGRSIMDLYHHDDLPVIKEIYESVMKKGQTAGASFCSKPYRFLIQNGCYILLETEWSSFVNPWSRKLEFVVGHHRVFQGPKICNVFETPPNSEPKIAEELQNKNTRIKEEIVNLLAEKVSRPSDTVKQEVSRRCQALASFMETLMDEVSRADLKLELPHENELTVSERDSVMLGEISPHHDYYDSKSSIETPPSYNQLNYNENLLRFFNSKPVTAPVEVDPPKVGSSDVSSTREDARSTLSPLNGFEGSGASGSSGHLTSGSNIHMSSATNTSNAGTGTGTVTGTGTIIATSGTGTVTCASGNMDANTSAAFNIGANTSAADNFGADTSAADTSGADTSAADNYAVDNYGPGNFGAENSCADNSGAENSCADNSGVDNSRPDNSGADNSAADNFGADNSGPDNSGADNSRPDNTGPDNSGAENSRAENSRADNSRPDHPRPDISGASNSRPDNTGPDKSGAENSASGSGSGTSGGEGPSSGGQDTRTTAGTPDSPPVSLTESLLNKHNDEMEKFMLKKHRESRGDRRTVEKNKNKTANTIDSLKILEYSSTGPGHATKRGGSYSWEGEGNKPKQQPTLNSVGVGTGVPEAPIPPVHPTHTTHTAIAQSSFSAQQSLFPTFYYIPATPLAPSTPAPGALSPTPRNQKHHHHPHQHAPKVPDQASTSQQAAGPAAMPLQYVAGVMYPHPSLFYTHPAAAAATAMMYQPMPFPGIANAMQLPEQPSTSQSNYSKTVFSTQQVIVAPPTITTTTATTTPKTQGAFHSITPAQLQRPSSKDTSVKTEPASNATPSHSSNKKKANSPIASGIGDYNSNQACSRNRANVKKYTDSNGNSDDMDGSSFSSFYSSFIKTTDGSESPPDNDKEAKHRKLKNITRLSSKIMEHPEEDQTQHGDG
ncbi:period circadian protein isoform X2 [Drosophila miranda]|uniref:period circadian protein isoform X2 n=1 Tax=Drosophila miranda TaxID=7229 RepID=UPI0007E69508|nr:period circadian protein isoform X2 [Drosophila miranda]